MDEQPLTHAYRVFYILEYKLNALTTANAITHQDPYICSLAQYYHYGTIVNKTKREQRAPINSNLATNQFALSIATIRVKQNAQTQRNTLVLCAPDRSIDRSIYQARNYSQINHLASPKYSGRSVLDVWFCGCCLQMIGIKNNDNQITAIQQSLKISQA